MATVPVEGPNVGANDPSQARCPTRNSQNPVRVNFRLLGSPKGFSCRADGVRAPIAIKINWRLSINNIQANEDIDPTQACEWWRRRVLQALLKRSDTASGHSKWLIVAGQRAHRNGGSETALLDRQLWLPKFTIDAQS